MKKEYFEQLQAVIRGTISEDAKSADDALRQYIRAKTQSLVLGEALDVEDDMEGDEEHSEPDEDDMEGDEDVTVIDKDEECDDDMEDDLSIEDEEKAKKAKAKSKKK